MFLGHKKERKPLPSHHPKSLPPHNHPSHIRVDIVDGQLRDVLGAELRDVDINVAEGAAVEQHFNCKGGAHAALASGVNPGE